MGSGYILVLAVLLLGGVIATLGDRIGMKVGKARLSLFNLRPRQTATLVSIATGSVISASTLALLFGVSSQLRTGVFELGQIQDDLETARSQLSNAESAKAQVESELQDATQERAKAQAQLAEINQFLQTAVERQQQTKAQLEQTRQQLASVSSQAQGLRGEISQLRNERAKLLQQQQEIGAKIAARDAEIAERDAAIAERDNAIAQREQRLAELQERQAFLSEQVANLENQYEGLFRGNIALGRNQELVSGVVRVSSPAQAAQVFSQLLLEANRAAIQRIAPGTPIDRPVITFENREIERLINRISDGQEYVVRILSAANYVTGEDCLVQGQQPCIQVFASAIPNQLIYDAGERLAVTSLDGYGYSDRQIVEQLNLLIASTQFRARQDGVVEDRIVVADNRIETQLQFLEAVKRYGRPLSLEAIAANPIYTTGPIHIELLAVQNNEVLFRTEPDTSVNNDVNTRDR